MSNGLDTLRARLADVTRERDAARKEYASLLHVVHTYGGMLATAAASTNDTLREHAYRLSDTLKALR